LFTVLVFWSCINRRYDRRSVLIQPRVGRSQAEDGALTLLAIGVD